jgi:uncharacterized membrane protein
MDDGDQQDVDYLSNPPTTYSGVAALPREKKPAGILSRAHWLRAVGNFLSAPFSDLPPASRGRWPRIARFLLWMLVLAFIVYFTAYTWALFDAFRSNAEDMGIMDQALWNTLHGATLHQTICNNISDTNCLGDVSRFAIHFEPLMLPISLLYIVAPSPKTLMLLQATVLGSGAFPVYWIASRRLASPLAGLGFATAYLLYPALQSAELFDFHAVTLAAAFLMFALYFMLSRNNIGLIIACVLSLSTKEEIPIDIIMIALVILVFQRRWRLGFFLIGLSIAWLALSLAVMHAFSPLGHSSTVSRYSYLGSSPLQVTIDVLTHPLLLLRDQILSPNGKLNLHSLFGSVAYLPTLSPQVVVLAVPALLINLLSSDPRMQTGVHQYSAELVPFIILAAISSVVFLMSTFAAGARQLWSLASRLRQNFASNQQPGSVMSTPGWQRWKRSLLLHGRGKLLSLPSPQVVASRLILLLMLLAVGRFDLRYNTLGDLPDQPNFAWPVVTPHDQLFAQVAALIPPNASVSAQDTLVPHLSHRHNIYQYPYMALQSQYVVLDLQGNIYPYAPNTASGQEEYDQSVQNILLSGDFGVIFSQDGYLLLQHLYPPASSA